MSTNEELATEALNAAISFRDYEPGQMDTIIEEGWEETANLLDRLADALAVAPVEMHTEWGSRTVDDPYVRVIPEVTARDTVRQWNTTKGISVRAEVVRREVTDWAPVSDSDDTPKNFPNET